MKCEHYACRCARAAELAALADRTGDARLLAQAIEVHSQPVTCRIEPERLETESNRSQP